MKKIENYLNHSLAQQKVNSRSEHQKRKWQPHDLHHVYQTITKTFHNITQLRPVFCWLPFKLLLFCLPYCTIYHTWHQVCTIFAPLIFNYSMAIRKRCGRSFSVMTTTEFHSDTIKSNKFCVPFCNTRMNSLLIMLIRNFNSYK